jgi:hypothetical protein
VKALAVCTAAGHDNVQLPATDGGTASTRVFFHYPSALSFIRRIPMGETDDSDD